MVKRSNENLMKQAEKVLFYSFERSEMEQKIPWKSQSCNLKSTKKEEKKTKYDAANFVCM